jgi:hypothetical protein
MDESSMLAGVVLMLVASVGALLTAALVIAFGLYRLVTRLFAHGAAARGERVRHRHV